MQFFNTATISGLSSWALFITLCVTFVLVQWGLARMMFFHVSEDHPYLRVMGKHLVQLPTMVVYNYGWFIWLLQVDLVSPTVAKVLFGFSIATLLLALAADVWVARMMAVQAARRQQG